MSSSRSSARRTRPRVSVLPVVEDANTDGVDPRLDVDGGWTCPEGVVPLANTVDHDLGVDPVPPKASTW